MDTPRDNQNNTLNATSPAATGASFQAATGMSGAKVAVSGNGNSGAPGNPTAPIGVDSSSTYGATATDQAPKIVPVEDHAGAEMVAAAHQESADKLAAAHAKNLEVKEKMNFENQPKQVPPQQVVFESPAAMVNKTI